MNDKVLSVPRDQFLNSPMNTLAEFFENEFKIDFLKIYEDRISLTESETQIDVSDDPNRNSFPRRGPLLVPGIRVEISIPYSGDYDLWWLRPNPYGSIFPFANIDRKGSNEIGYVRVVIQLPLDVSEKKFVSLKDETINGIRRYLERQKVNIDQFNSQLPKMIKGSIQARFDQIEKRDGIIQSLGIPLKHNENAPRFEPIKIEKRISVALPPAPQHGFEPEPGIRMDTYEDILRIIRHEGRTFESTPATYSVHNEEGLRDILLAHLNGHFLGNATGEAFRKSGKTDIKIEEESRAAFVAECKIWAGSQKLVEACDQLLGYLTWRDCKTALIVFNKNISGFTPILEKANATMEKSPCFARSIAAENEKGEWRYIFRDPNDESREITIHLFLFNIFVKKGKR